MAKQRLMTAMDTKQMLVMLFPDLDVSESDQTVEQTQQVVFGTYIDDNDVPVSLCAIDWPLAAGLGAALTLVPADTAASAAETGQFSETIMGNLREVFNILSRAFMDGSSPHLRFAEVRMGREALNADEAAILDGCAARMNMKLIVAGYGVGHCSMLTL